MNTPQVFSASPVLLVRGMYGSEYNPASNAMGLVCGQMRPMEHNCLTCGKHPYWGRETCQCRYYETLGPCQKMTHNSSWFNQHGEKLGWGDLCACDLYRVSKALPESEVFYVLPEYKSYWDLKHTKRNLEAPGLDLIHEHASHVIVSGAVINFLRDSEERGTAQIGCLSYVRLGKNGTEVFFRFLKNRLKKAKSQ